MAELSINEAIIKIDTMVEEFVYTKCVNTLKGTCPVDTGALRGSIHAEKESDELYFVGTDFWYAKFTEYGRGPVFPKAKKALYWPDLEHPVRHAGPAKAQHWVEAAVAQLK